ncbi:MAG: hypothetical protein RL380_1047 [Verrucomicrobiota bacterium]
MKHFKAMVLASLAAVVLTGCDNIDDTPAPKAARKPRASVKPKPVVARAEKPAKVVKDPEVGTRDYLDFNQGFRDAKFGMTVDRFENLSIVSKDERLGLATYVRAGDVKEFVGVPLESIQYTFFRDKLARVDLKWKAEYPGSVTLTPLSTQMAVRCSSQYGRPRKQVRNKDVAQYLWAGQEVEILMDEFFLPGMATPPSQTRTDSGGSIGWDVPPTTTGQMVMRSIALKKEMDTLAAQVANQTHNGL